jgi:hypothetical protein
MRIIFATRQSVCSNTGRIIQKGEKCYYDSFQKMVFSIESVETRKEQDQKPIQSTLNFAK